MQSDTLFLDKLKDKLLCAVDAEYNVLNAEIVLDIISQLEKIDITKEQLQKTRLGREINTIRQKLDGRKNITSQNNQNLPSNIEIAQRAKRLLRSWQGLLTVPQVDSANNISSSTTEDVKPRLILKVKLNSPIKKRKHESHSEMTSNKRKKTQVMQTPLPLSTPISPAVLTETNGCLPRLKTTQQLLLEMQRNEPNVLSTQTSTVHAILQKKIIDESLYEPVKVDYSALHHGRDLKHTSINSVHYQRNLSSTITSPSNTMISINSSSKMSSHIQRSTSAIISSNSNWENGSSAGSPISPLSISSSSSSLTSTSIWSTSTTVPQIPVTISNMSDKKQSEMCDEQNFGAMDDESSKEFPIDSTMTSVLYDSVADLVKDHRRRILAEYETRELEARPDLLLVPIDQLAFVYERERIRESNSSIELKHFSTTSIEKLNEPFDLIALPFVDCPMEFNFTLDELVVQHSTLTL